MEQFHEPIQTGLDYFPLVIDMHGGGGICEWEMGVVPGSGSVEYPRRFARRGCAVVTPQLLLWTNEERGPKFDRQILDDRLKQCGGSITALEIYQIQRCIDYLCTHPSIDSNRVAAVGCSYGVFTRKLASLREAIRSNCLADGVFRTADYRGETDDRANALAVLAGVAGAQEHASMVAVLTQIRHASPYMERFVLEALFELGECGHALQRMRERYAPMVNSRYSTLNEQWEYLNPTDSTSSYNHAWSGCPAHLLPHYVAGLHPRQAGWRRFSVCVKDVCGSFYSRVPLAQGDIEVRYLTGSWQTMLWISVPPQTVAEWCPDYSKVKNRFKINGWLVIDNGVERSLPPGVSEIARGDRSTLILSPGHYTIEAF